MPLAAWHLKTKKWPQSGRTCRVPGDCSAVVAQGLSSKDSFSHVWTISWHWEWQRIVHDDCIIARRMNATKFPWPLWMSEPSAFSLRANCYSTSGVPRGTVGTGGLHRWTFHPSDQEASGWAPNETRWPETCCNLRSCLRRPALTWARTKSSVSGTPNYPNCLWRKCWL